MAYTLQQSRQSVTTGADSTALSFLALPQVNSLIVVTVATFNGNLATTSVTDNQGNTYARAAVSNDFETVGGSDDIALYYALAATSSGTFTITVNPDGAAADITFHVMEFRGNATSTPLDQTNASAANGTAATSGNVTPTETNELLVMAVSHSGSNRTITETNGTLVLENEGGSADMPLGTAYKVQTSIVTEGGAWTIGTGAVNYGAVVASFKVAAAAGGLLPRTMLMGVG